MIYAETDRLYLRQLTEDDLPRLVELIGDWEVAQWIVRVPYPYNDADAQDWLTLQKQNDTASKPEFFVIADKANNRLMGGIGLHPHTALATESSVRELGYWLGQPYWGQGFMSEAVSEIVKFAFGRLALQALVSSTNPDNARSRHVLSKAGFTELGLVPRPAEHLRGSLQINSWRLTRGAYQAAMGITLEPPRS
jgi:RimJ/RimL family protein N-acetyltransferase